MMLWRSGFRMNYIFHLLYINISATWCLCYSSCILTQFWIFALFQVFSNGSLISVLCGRREFEELQSTVNPTLLSSPGGCLSLSFHSDYSNMKRHTGFRGFYTNQGETNIREALSYISPNKALFLCPIYLCIFPHSPGELTLYRQRLHPIKADLETVWDVFHVKNEKVEMISVLKYQPTCAQHRDVKFHFTYSDKSSYD